MSLEENLLKKIQSLESELDRKNQDLKIYKKELSRINSQIETLIEQNNDLLRQSLRIQKFCSHRIFPISRVFNSAPSLSPVQFPVVIILTFLNITTKCTSVFSFLSFRIWDVSSFLSVLMKVNYGVEESNRKSPKALITEIFEKMKSEGALPKDHSSLFYASFDRRKFQMTYCNVGQPVILHYQSAGDRIELLSGCPKPFYCDKKISDYEIEDKKVDLNPKDN